MASYRALAFALVTCVVAEEPRCQADENVLLQGVMRKVVKTGVEHTIEEFEDEDQLGPPAIEGFAPGYRGRCRTSNGRDAGAARHTPDCPYRRGRRGQAVRTSNGRAAGADVVPARHAQNCAGECRASPNCQAFEWSAPRRGNRQFPRTCKLYNSPMPGPGGEVEEGGYAQCYNTEAAAEVAAEAVAEAAAQGDPVLIMKAYRQLSYDNPLWENTETLNPSSPVDEEVEAKYDAFMTSRFNTIILCVGGPTDRCITHPLEDTWESAHALFTAGFIRDDTIDQATWLSNFDAGNGVNVLCPMQRPGFNTLGCFDDNKARFGWFNNVRSQPCQDDSGDSDGAIGIGLRGQDGGSGGAGFTKWFGDPVSTRNQRFTWVYVTLQ